MASMPIIIYQLASQRERENDREKKTIVWCGLNARSNKSIPNQQSTVHLFTFHVTWALKSKRTWKRKQRHAIRKRHQIFFCFSFWFFVSFGDIFLWYCPFKLASKPTNEIIMDKVFNNQLLYFRLNNVLRRMLLLLSFTLCIYLLCVCVCVLWAAGCWV